MLHLVNSLEPIISSLAVLRKEIPECLEPLASWRGPLDGHLHVGRGCAEANQTQNDFAAGGSGLAPVAAGSFFGNRSPIWSGKRS
jgi:hypothetical protein